MKEIAVSLNGLMEFFSTTDRLTEKHMYLVGQLTARLQLNAPGKSNRRYWDAEGLVGPKAKFGNLDQIAGSNVKQRRIILKTRKLVYTKLKAFQNKYPKKLGLIHADLHFGNLIWTDNQFAVIDFDDCGYGLHISDLVVPIMSAERIYKGRKYKSKKLALKKALIAGYKSLKAWDQADDEIFSTAVIARNLSVLGWINSRTDNPRFRSFLKKFVKLIISRIKDYEYEQRRKSVSL